MEMNDYQKQAAETAVYRNALKTKDERIVYTALGVGGEGGEVANQVQKAFVAGLDNVLFNLDDERMRDELGDVLWYLAMLAHECGWTLEDVAEHNLAKLKMRHGAK